VPAGSRYFSSTSTNSSGEEPALLNDREVLPGNQAKKHPAGLWGHKRRPVLGHFSVVEFASPKERPSLQRCGEPIAALSARFRWLATFLFSL